MTNADSTHPKEQYVPGSNGQTAGTTPSTTTPHNASVTPHERVTSLANNPPALRLDEEDGDSVQAESQERPEVMPTVANVIGGVQKALENEHRAAMLNRIVAPPYVPADGSQLRLNSDEEVEDFRYPWDLQGITHNFRLDRPMASAPADAAKGVPQHRPRNIDSSSVVTIAAGQVPYMFDAEAVARLLAALLTKLGIAGSPSEVLEYLYAVRPHEVKKNLAAPQNTPNSQATRRCGLFFIEIDRRANGIISGLLNMHQRVLLSDTHAVVANRPETLVRWTEARDALVDRVLHDYPDIRSCMHSRFKKGLGPMSLEASGAPRDRRGSADRNAARTQPGGGQQNVAAPQQRQSRASASAMRCSNRSYAYVTQGTNVKQQQRGTEAAAAPAWVRNNAPRAADNSPPCSTFVATSTSTNLASPSPIASPAPSSAPTASNPVSLGLYSQGDVQW